MIFRVPLRIEIERPDTEFSATHEVPFQLVYERGRWRAECHDPPVATFLCDNLEEALTTAAREIAADLTRQVAEQPSSVSPEPPR